MLLPEDVLLEPPTPPADVELLPEPVPAPEVELPELDPAPAPEVELPELDPAPAPEVELPEDAEPVEPAPATPRVVVVLLPVATTTVDEPEPVVVAVTVVALLEPPRARECEPDRWPPEGCQGSNTRFAERVPHTDDLRGVLGATFRLDGAVVDAIAVVGFGAQALVVAIGAAVDIAQHARDTVFLKPISKIMRQ